MIKNSTYSQWRRLSLQKNLFAGIILFTGIITGSCSLQKKVQTDMYFGLLQPDGNAISDSAWNVFVQTQVSKVFSDGFTVIDAKGKWMDTQNKQLISEPSRIVISVNNMTEKLSKQIDSLRIIYRHLFHQQSVLRVDRKSKVDF